MPRTAGISLISGAIVFALVLFVGSCSNSPVESENDAPRISSISAIGVVTLDSIPRFITVTFDRMVRSENLEFSITPDLGGSAGVSGSVLRYVPRLPLNFGTNYTARIRGRFIAGDGSATIIDREWTFTLLSRTELPQLLSSVSPVGDFIGQELPDHIEIRFSDSVISSSLELMSTPSIAGDMELRGSVLLFMPASPFKTEVSYRFRLLGHIVTDKGLRRDVDYSWEFSSVSVQESYIYVAPGRVGDGTRASPFGSIQDGIDEALRNQFRTTVLVAAGEYHEALMISGGVTMFGGRDTALGWLESENKKSVVACERDTSQTALVNIHSPDATVRISDFVFVDTIASDLCHHVATALIDSSPNVVFEDCKFSRRDGNPGLHGGLWNLAKGGKGGAGGYDGGYYWTDSLTGEWHWVPSYVPEQPGENGDCYLSEGTGGAGGARDGARGEGGAGGAFAVSADRSDSTLVVVLGSGCGGGGGSGGRGGSAGHSSGGPSGGTGGAGGNGGQAGESAIGIICISGNLELFSTLIDVGSGGNGGAGSDGEPGKWDWASTGGDGGHGGGGAGGSSIGVLSVGSTVTVGSGVVFKLGSAGKGGTSSGNPGLEGVVREVYVVQ